MAHLQSQLQWSFLQDIPGVVVEADILAIPESEWMALDDLTAPTDPEGDPEDDDFDVAAAQTARLAQAPVVHAWLVEKGLFEPAALPLEVFAPVFARVLSSPFALPLLGPRPAGN